MTSTAARDQGSPRYAPLTEVDAPAAEALSAEAGWNQTAADWRLLIGLRAALGCFAGGGDGGDRRLVGSALLVPYGGRLAWLAMVLVTAGHRRRGVATRLVAECLARADRDGLTVGLDATPAGREVYRRLGFRDGFGLHRLAADAPAPAPVGAAGVSIRPMRPADLAAVAALDALAFGADRTPVLAYLHAARPDRAVVAEADGGRLRGHAFVRHGRLAHHLGPLAADDPEIATALAARALAGLEGRAVVDVPDDQAAFLVPLGGWGFRPLRPFTRMFRADAAVPPGGDPGRTFAIAGPELG